MNSMMLPPPSTSFTRSPLALNVSVVTTLVAGFTPLESTAFCVVVRVMIFRLSLVYVACHSLYSENCTSGKNQDPRPGAPA
ncbi:hypothetical protein [Paenibacillus harenae]|uniref:hypothetical protein n=1 Tax=Paenibacillus harenae TaxID=306543 RepID=UPI0027D87B9C|nr:hypothetical protein [Paenibacillus harenae]